VRRRSVRLGDVFRRRAGLCGHVGPAGPARLLLEAGHVRPLEADLPALIIASDRRNSERPDGAQALEIAELFNKTKPPVLKISLNICQRVRLLANYTARMPSESWQRLRAIEPVSVNRPKSDRTVLVAGATGSVRYMRDAGNGQEEPVPQMDVVWGHVRHRSQVRRPCPNAGCHRMRLPEVGIPSSLARAEFRPNERIGSFPRTR
jgi:hypothetical protein